MDPGRPIKTPFADLAAAIIMLATIVVSVVWIARVGLRHPPEPKPPAAILFDGRETTTFSAKGQELTLSFGESRSAVYTALRSTCRKSCRGRPRGTMLAVSSWEVCLCGF